MCHAYAWAAGLYLHAKASLNRGGPPVALKGHQHSRHHCHDGVEQEISCL